MSYSGHTVSDGNDNKTQNSKNGIYTITIENLRCSPHDGNLKNKVVNKNPAPNPKP